MTIHPRVTDDEKQHSIVTGFDHDRERHALRHARLNELRSHNLVGIAPKPSILESRARALPARFQTPRVMARYLGVPPLAINLEQFTEYMGTRGLLVWHQGFVVHEQYAKGHAAEVRWMTNSASKPVVAMLVACAQARGDLGPAETLITQYWPELKGTAWESVTIGHCLAMTTGIDFVEESLDLEGGEAHYAKLFDALVFGSIDRFIAKLGRRAPAGVEVVYSSIDTEALGGTLIRATGKSIAELLEEYIWKPAGMEMPAYWMTDTTGREMALAGLCASLRDYARLGLIMLHDGRWNGQQIVPSEPINAFSHPDPKLFEMPGHDDYPLIPVNQTFVPNNVADQRGDYMAAGSWGQIIYVDPRHETVIAHHGICADITTEYIELTRAFFAFRQISEELATHS
jgi:CubicO group peptidase (beta-lactamase class C family)